MRSLTASSIANGWHSEACGTTVLAADMTKAGNLAIPGLQSAKSDSLGVLSGSLFSGGFRSLGSGNLGCGFGFLHHGLLRAHRLGDELDDGCRSGHRRDAERS